MVKSKPYEANVYLRDGSVLVHIFWSSYQFRSVKQKNEAIKLLRKERKIELPEKDIHSIDIYKLSWDEWMMYKNGQIKVSEGELRSE